MKCAVRYASTHELNWTGSAAKKPACIADQEVFEQNTREFAETVTKLNLKLFLFILNKAFVDI